MLGWRLWPICTIGSIGGSVSTLNQVSGRQHAIVGEAVFCFKVKRANDFQPESCRRDITFFRWTGR